MEHPHKQRPERIARVLKNRTSSRTVILSEKAVWPSFGIDYCGHAKAGTQTYLLLRTDAPAGYRIVQNRRKPLGIWLDEELALMPAMPLAAATDVFRTYLEKSGLTYNKLIAIEEVPLPD